MIFVALLTRLVLIVSFGLAGAAGGLMMLIGALAFDIATTTGSAGWEGIAVSAIAFIFGGGLFLQAGYHLRRNR